MKYFFFGQDLQIIFAETAFALSLKIAAVGALKDTQLLIPQPRLA